MTAPSTSKPTRAVTAIRVLVLVVAVLWLVEVADSVVLDDSLQQYGIRPRTWDGLWGVVSAPFLHGTYGHLMTNTLPFVVLGGLLLLRGWREWVVVSVGVALLGGLATWLFGRSAIHIGVSGVIFGYLGFLLAAGFFERSARAVATAVVVGILYGGMLWGIVPTDGGISWEGHLFGLLAGVAVARLGAGAEEPVTA